MTIWRFSNFVRTVLDIGVSQAGTILTVPTVDSLDMPTPLGATEQFPLTLWDGQNDPEIVYVTANPGTGLLTVLRGQEGSNQAAWPAGTEVRMAPTAAIFLASLTQAAQNAIDLAAAIAGFTALTYSVAQYADNATLALTDSGKIIESTKATAMALTIPPNSAVPFTINTRIDFVQFGAGQLSFIAGAGVTIRSAAGNLKIFQQYGAASAYKRATNEWVLAGNLTA